MRTNVLTFKCIAVGMPLVLWGCFGGNRREIVECREAASKMATAYDKNEWQTQEFHYNTHDQHCYLRLASESADTLLNGQRLYRKNDLIMDVDENREVIGCALARTEGDPKESWICSVPGQSKLPTYADFLTERNRLLER